MIVHGNATRLWRFCVSFGFGWFGSVWATSARLRGFVLFGLVWVSNGIDGGWATLLDEPRGLENVIHAMFLLTLADAV